MTREKATDPEARAFWLEAQRRLSLADPEPTVTLDRIVHLGQAIPARHLEESLKSWLQRVKVASHPSGKVIPFPAKPHWRFTPLAEIKRLAADSRGTEIPLPDPGRALETEDGRFRLTITAESRRIHLVIEALGFAADSLANRQLGIAGPRGEQELVAIIVLNEDGEGRAHVDDRPEVRQALLHPVIGLIEDADLVR